MRLPGAVTAQPTWSPQRCLLKHSNRFHRARANACNSWARPLSQYGAWYRCLAPQLVGAFFDHLDGREMSNDGATHDVADECEAMGEAEREAREDQRRAEVSWLAVVSVLLAVDASHLNTPPVSVLVTLGYGSSLRVLFGCFRWKPTYSGSGPTRRPRLSLTPTALEAETAMARERRGGW